MGGFLPSRRRFLGGAGTAVGLPYLASALPRAAWGQPAPSLPRFVPVFFPNGVDKRGWLRDPPGGDLAQSGAAILAPLAEDAALKAKTLVLDGLANVAAFGVHSRSTRGFLTCQKAPVDEHDFGGGPSIDQVIAQGLPPETRLPSLQLGVYSGGGRSINFAADEQPLPPIGNPKQVFDRIFGGFSAGEDRAEVERRTRYETSILDYVREEANLLSGRLARTDRDRLSRYLQGVRDLEGRLVRSLRPLACAAPADPGEAAAALPYPEKLALMIDLVVTALACDATRVLSLYSNTPDEAHPFLGIAEGHHDLSHWGPDVEKRDLVQKIDVWQMQQFARLARALDAIPDGDGRTLLDACFLMFGSEISEGDTHLAWNLPIVVCGGMGGRFPTGKYVRVRGDLGELDGVSYLDNLPLAWLYTDVALAMGVRLGRFGADPPGSLLDDGHL